MPPLGTVSADIMLGQLRSGANRRGLFAYTKVDPLSRLTVVENKIEWASVGTNEDTYLYKDFGAGHFTDFEHKLEAYYDSASDSEGECDFWGLGNIVDDSWARFQAGELIFLGFSYDELYLYGVPFGGIASWACAKDTLYYITVSRVGTAVTAKIYSDPERTDLLATLEITNAVPSYRYLYPFSAWNYGENYGNGFGYMQNLNLQEPPPNIRPMGYW